MKAILLKKTDSGFDALDCKEVMHYSTAVKMFSATLDADSISTSNINHTTYCNDSSVAEVLDDLEIGYSVFNIDAIDIKRYTDYLITVTATEKKLRLCREYCILVMKGKINKQCAIYEAALKKLNENSGK